MALDSLIVWFASITHVPGALAAFTALTEAPARITTATKPDANKRDTQESPLTQLLPPFTPNDERRDQRKQTITHERRGPRCS
jgi:hypothetical protein